MYESKQLIKTNISFKSLPSLVQHALPSCSLPSPHAACHPSCSLPSLMQPALPSCGRHGRGRARPHRDRVMITAAVTRGGHGGTSKYLSLVVTWGGGASKSGGDMYTGCRGLRALLRILFALGSSLHYYYMGTSETMPCGHVPSPIFKDFAHLETFTCIRNNSGSDNYIIIKKIRGSYIART
jgi:hypothetical protein